MTGASTPAHLCQKEFSDDGLVASFVQGNVLLNRSEGTLRGFHVQGPPHQETKLFSRIRGAACDVIIGVRPRSRTFCRWFGVELTAANYRMLYVPAGFAQGFITLEDDTELFYLTSESYAPSHENGIRYDDPSFGVKSPLVPRVVSEKDQT